MLRVRGRSQGVASSARNASNAKGGSHKAFINSASDQPRQRHLARKQNMGVLTARLAAKPVTATGLADKAAWFHQFDTKSWWDQLSLFIVLVGIALVISTFRDYGVTWDEDVH